MTGLWILALLILISALPIFVVFIWFRAIRFPLRLPWFFCSLAAGAAALLLAGLLQSLFPPLNGVSMGALLFKLFIQVALTEEAGRLVFLCLLFWFRRRLIPPVPAFGASPSSAFGAATGLLTGLGFAVIETATYGAVNPGTALLRAFTAAPLHGACGCRVGLTVVNFRREPARGLLFFIYAVAIHGMYNFMVISPGLPPVFPVVLVFATLLSSIQVIRRKV
jgi:RsiW-degrading membrane proteinase PrsW (M82 family)